MEKLFVALVLNIGCAALASAQTTCQAIVGATAKIIPSMVPGCMPVTQESIAQRQNATSALDVVRYDAGNPILSKCANRSIEVLLQSTKLGGNKNIFAMHVDEIDRMFATGQLRWASPGFKNGYEKWMGMVRNNEQPSATIFLVVDENGSVSLGGQTLNAGQENAAPRALVGKLQSSQGGYGAIAKKPGFGDKIKAGPTGGYQHVAEPMKGD
jgi:hypothetical protein